MSSPTGTPSKAPGALTNRDVQLLGIAMQSMKDPTVQLDYDKFAELSGLTVGSGRTIWGKLRRKLAANSGVEGNPASEASQSAKPKAKKGGRKRKVDEADTPDNGGNETVSEPQSPTALASERRKKRVKTSHKNDVPAQESENEAGSASDEGKVEVKAEDGAVIKSEKK